MGKLDHGRVFSARAPGEGQTRMCPRAYRALVTVPVVRCLAGTFVEQRVEGRAGALDQSVPARTFSYFFQNALPGSGAPAMTSMTVIVRGSTMKFCG